MKQLCIQRGTLAAESAIRIVFNKKETRRPLGFAVPPLPPILTCHVPGCERGSVPRQRIRRPAKSRASFDKLDFLGAQSYMLRSITPTLVAARFIVGKLRIYFAVEIEPFAACSMREATARGCDT